MFSFFVINYFFLLFVCSEINYTQCMCCIVRQTWVRNRTI